MGTSKFECLQAVKGWLNQNRTEIIESDKTWDHWESKFKEDTGFYLSRQRMSMVAYGLGIMKPHAEKKVNAMASVQPLKEHLISRIKLHIELYEWMKKSREWIEAEFHSWEEITKRFTKDTGVTCYRKDVSAVADSMGIKRKKRVCEFEVFKAVNQAQPTFTLQQVEDMMNRLKSAEDKLSKLSPLID
jgi:hypothetical protein